MAVGCGQKEILDCLVAAGGDVNQDQDNESLLAFVYHPSAFQEATDKLKHLKTITQLVKLGATLNAFDLTKGEDYDEDEFENFFDNCFSYWHHQLASIVKACCQGLYDSLAAIYRAGANVNCYIRDYGVIDYVSIVTDEKPSHERGLEFMLHIGMLDWAKMLWAAGCERGEVEFWSNADMDWYEAEDATEACEQIPEKVKIATMAFVYDTVQQPRSLADLSRIVVRNELSCHITRKVEQLGVPHTLQEYLLIPELDEIVRQHKNTCTHTTVSAVYSRH